MSSSHPFESNIPSPPYLPPQLGDPGIPPKAQRPSIRERGLLIWILVISIIGVLNFSYNFDGESSQYEIYNSAYRGAHDAYTGQDNTEYDYLVRTEVAVTPVKEGALIYSVVTNSGRIGKSFYDVKISGYTGENDLTYISGPKYLAPGEATVVVAFIANADSVAVRPIVFEDFASADGGVFTPEIVSFEDSPEDGNSVTTVFGAYKNLALADYKAWAEQKSVKE